MFMQNALENKKFVNKYEKESSSVKRYQYKVDKDFNLNTYKSNKPKFDIWSLYDLQTTFIREIRSYQLHPKLEQEIIDWQRQKIKILRYNLDSFYNYRIINYNNYIIIHHLWHDELFDIDQYDLDINYITYKNTIEYTLGNVFDMVMNKVINKQYDLNDNLIMSIIINIYSFARFDYKYFKYIYDNCQHEDFKDKVGSRILLYNLVNKK